MSKETTPSKAGCGRDEAFPSGARAIPLPSQAANCQRSSTNNNMSKETTLSKAGCGRDEAFPSEARAFPLPSPAANCRRRNTKAAYKQGSDEKKKAGPIGDQP